MRERCAASRQRDRGGDSAPPDAIDSRLIPRAYAFACGSMAARHPDLLAFLDAEPNIEYVVAMAKNAVLKRKAKPPTLCPRMDRGHCKKNFCRLPWLLRCSFEASWQPRLDIWN